MILNNKEVLNRLICTITFLSFFSMGTAQTEVEYNRRVNLSIGTSFNKIHLSNQEVDESITKPGLFIDLGYQYKGRGKTELVFNLSHLIAPYDENSTLLKELQLISADPIETTQLLAGFKIYFGEKIKAFFMPQFGFGRISRKVFVAKNNQGIVVFNERANNRTLFALSGAVGADIPLKERLFLTVHSQYLVTSKTYGHDSPLFRLWNNTLGVAYQF